MLTKFKTQTMKTKQILGLIVATIALAIFVTTPVFASGDHHHHDDSDFANIREVNVNGFSHFSPWNDTSGVFAGQALPIRVTFEGTDYEEDVRIVARILGQPGFSEVTERFDVLEGSTYSRVLNFEVPFDLDEDLNDEFTLEISIESKDEVGDEVKVHLEVQRSNYELEVLSVDSDSEVRAGETLVLDVAIKNRGRHEAEDAFIRASIPELGISKRIFLGDLSSVDQDDPEKFDSDVGRLFLRIPSTAAAGIYTVEVETFTDDAKTVVSKKVVVTGASDGSRVISGMNSKSIATGVKENLSLTIVNAGNSIEVYELVLEGNPALNIAIDETIIAVPAGESKTVKLGVTANEKGTHNFAVNVHSNGELVKSEAFVVNAEGSAVSTGNAAFLLTVILAIIFVVLLIVLIVLLTRKPDRSEEFGESYY